MGSSVLLTGVLGDWAPACSGLPLGGGGAKGGKEMGERQSRPNIKPPKCFSSWPLGDAFLSGTKWKVPVGAE